MWVWEGRKKRRDGGSGEVMKIKRIKIKMMKE